MWCPKCKNEYRAGITVCPDCNEELLEELNSSHAVFVPLFQTADSEMKDKITKYLIHCNRNIKEEIEEKDTELGIKIPVFSILVAEEDLKEAVIDIKTVLAYDAKENEDAPPAPKPKRRGPVVSELYVDAKERCREYKSTGIMFLVFAVLLLVFGAMNASGMVNIMASTVSLILIFGAALGFLAVGISSLAKVSSLREEASAEEKTTEEITAYLKEHFSKEYFLSEQDENTSSELLYFQRVEQMKEALAENFPDAEEGYIDALLEDYYNSLNL